MAIRKYEAAEKLVSEEEEACKGKRRDIKNYRFFISCWRNVF